jgi:indolepyruvate decarboxylase
MIGLESHVPKIDTAHSDPDELAEVVAEIAAMLKAARNPIIIAGIEVHRFGLTGAVMAFAEKHGIPVCSTLLGKSVVSEKHPLYAGTYVGALSRPGLVEFVEASDFVLSLGAPSTDTDTGVFTTRLVPERTVHATSLSVRIRHHAFDDVRLGDLLAGLAGQQLPVFNRPLPPRDNPLEQPWVPAAGAPLTTGRLFHKVNSVLSKALCIVADPGDAMFGAIDLSVHDGADFLATAFYATLGWAVPAAIGAQVARGGVRPLVLVGDGAFQMTGTELSTAVRLGLDPIVVVLNNRGYLTERFILEGKFNDIHNWNYHQLPSLLGGGEGCVAATEEEFSRALDHAVAAPGRFHLIEARLDPNDASPALRRLGERLAAEAKG